MTIAMACEVIDVAAARQLERRALDPQPAQRPADGDAEILSGNLIRPEPVDLQDGDASGRVARCYRHVAHAIARVTRRTQRPREVARVQIRAPRRLALARIVFL